MEFVPEEGKHLHEDCSTLILPALSIGNVGQLVADLLISSMGSERVGYLDDPNVLPCVGNDAYGPFPQGDLALPLEAYDSLSNALTIIQQRSPVVKGMMIEFAKNMADFLKAKGLKVTCLLCYCSEGDNISDAFQLGDAVCKLLQLNHPITGIESGKWRVPLSWMTVYGPPLDVSIF
uniref:Proteasome assembly chaperone 2 n=1 Tax=Glycine max TaxID=3847 RepID=C6TFG6_SOYBN|nr:unknown [Glycine max]